MDSINYLLNGFQIALEPNNLFFCFIGVLFGTLVGVLPGLGPVGGISLLLPLTFKLPATTGVIMLAGIYYGAMYGGSTTSILVNIPGEAASIVTCLDGYQMAKKGHAGPALGISAMGSFIAGTIGTVILMFFAPTLAHAALSFGPPEYFGLMCMGMVILTYLSKGSVTKGWIMALIGLFLGTIGQDRITGKFRFTFGLLDLSDGLEIVAVGMGLFGIGELLTNLEEEVKTSMVATRIRNLLPNLDDWKRSIGAIFRGTFLGFVLGILPGGGGIIASFSSYAMEKRISKHPEEFGKGAIEGVAGPEAANNAGATGSFVPLLALGIPPNVVPALILSVLLFHGITPGPLVIKNQPELFWGTVASMYLGNGMLLVLNLPLIGIWVKVLKIPNKILFPIILLFCLLGVYSVDYSVFDIYVMIFFGIVGYILRKYDFEGAPLALAMILGPMLENAFVQSMLIANGDVTVFIKRPISAIALAFSAVLLLSNLFKSLQKAREKATQE